MKAIAKAAAQRKRAVEGEDEHELDDDDEGEGGEETKRYRDEPGIISKLRKLSSNSPEWVDLRKYHAVINPRGSALGLQDFTSVLLGCPMKKELQCSPWGERPLQRDQLEYAALDAACLLDMFEKTVQRLIYKTHLSGDGQRSNDLGALEKAVKLEELLRERYQNRKGRKGQKSSSTKNNGGSSALASAFLNLQDWFDGSQERKFICDESLKGLAKQIRSCGFFCEFVTITDEFHELYDKWVAKKPQQEGEESKEDRNKEARQKKSYLRELLIKKIYEKSVAEGSVILTADKLLAQRFDRVYLVRSHGKGDQLKEVLEVFRLEILERNLFTRCITCNGDFVLLLKDRETDAEKKELLSEELPEKLLGKLLGKGDKSDMSREDLLSYLRKELPERLLVKHKEFWICTSCKQVYVSYFFFFFLFLLSFFLTPFPHPLSFLQWKGCRYKTALTNFKNSLLDLHVKLEHTE